MGAGGEQTGRIDPHLLGLSGGGSKAALVGQLAVVHGHLRRQATQLLWTGHRLGHLETREWVGVDRQRKTKKETDSG